eukprot:gene31278-7929_t
MPPALFRTLLVAAAEDRGGRRTESNRSAVDLWRAVKRMQVEMRGEDGRPLAGPKMDGVVGYGRPGVVWVPGRYVTNHPATIVSETVIGVMLHDEGPGKRR